MKEIHLIEHLLEEKLKCFSQNSSVDAACMHAIKGGGKIRPLIVLSIAKALGDESAAIHAALSVEFLHCASLVADDLPCMDDDLERRGEPSTHAQFGVETALLASYKLISIAFYTLSESTTSSIERHKLGLKIISARSVQMTDGQFLDLQGKSQALSKTTALFQSAFALGWIYGGGGFEHLPVVEEAAHHFGVAFQLADDIRDADASKENSLIDLERHLLLAKEALQKVGLLSDSLGIIIELFEKRLYDELSASCSS